MKGLLLHIAADTSNLGVVGPVFQDLSFEFLPVNNSYGIEKRTYRDFVARNPQYGRTLGDFLPSDIAGLPVHFDPEFDQYTYGQHRGDYPRFQILTKLEEGDAVFFFASLAPFDKKAYEHRDEFLKHYQRGKKNKYVIGFFTVKGVAQVFVFNSSPRFALALLNIRVLEEEGSAPLDMDDIAKELEILRQWGYIAKDGTYKLTRQRATETSRSGQEIIQVIDDLWPDSEDAQEQLLKKGLLNIEILSGNVTEENIKSNHHYKRLKPLDWDSFALIVGEPSHSGLLKSAVQLTEHFERNEFRLNNLGQAILGRTSDPMRGARWIDEGKVSMLAKKITEANGQLRDELRYLII